MTYRCQGCRNYHHSVYRKIGLGSVCSPECEATVRSRQRGGPPATIPLPLRDSTSNTQAVPGNAGDIHMDPSQRDGIHDSTSRSGDHDSKKIPREGPLATSRKPTSAVAPRHDRAAPRGTARSRDWHQRTLERDRRCRYCGTVRNLHVHHIDYRSQGGTHDLHNLIVLCKRHHDLVHTDKGVWQPVLRAYIWLLYIEGRAMFLLDVKRSYG